MWLFLVALLILLCVDISIRDSHSKSQYLDYDQTNSIKGIFIMIVFLNHARSYIQLSDSIFDQIYSLFFHLIGQMMVVMFLFYSGYGVAFQFFKKGISYKYTFFKKRVLRTWIHFVLAVILFAAIAVIMGVPYSVREWIWCWIGWESIGNSNWFIFDILVLYLSTYLAMELSTRQKTVYKNRFILVTMISSLLIWGGLWYLKSPARYWYNTILAYPFGMWYCNNQNRIDAFLQKKKHFIIVSTLFVFLFILFSFIRNSFGENVCSILFSSIILLLTMRVKIGNKVTNWMGIHLFPLFILQRIPMNVLSKYKLTPIVFVMGCFIITFLLVYPFEHLCKTIDNKMFRS